VGVGGDEGVEKGVEKGLEEEVEEWSSGGMEEWRSE
jgi:hypothetical protein